MPRIVLFAFLYAGICTYSSAAAAITAPYANDFSVSASDFTATSANQWLLSSGAYKNTVLSNSSSTSTLQFSNLGGPALTAADFTLSSNFSIMSSASDFNTNSVGFIALGESPDVTNLASNYYLADVYTNGNLRLAKLGSPVTLLKMENIGAPLGLNIPYSLTLDGTYHENGDLLLSLRVIGNSIDYSIASTIPAASVLTGNYFGYRNRATGGVASALTVEFNSYNVTAIPEPSSFGFVATSLIAGYAIGTWYRRRSAKILA